MSTTAELMAAGMPAQQAKQLGQDLSSSVSAAGTTQGTATQIASGCSIVTTVPASGGVLLPSATGASESFILNAGAGNVLTVYPATGEKINNNAANAGIQVAVNKAVDLIPSGQTWIAILSA